MTTTGTITTYYVDSTGVDLGKQFVEKDYLISVYPNLIPNFKSAGLFVCGQNSNGELGDQTIIGKSSFVQTIARGNNWKYISAGRSFALGIKTDGTLWTWGRNNLGQLGDQTIVNKSSPIQTITYATDWKIAIASEQSALAIKTDGTLWTWGFNGQGQLGDNTIIHRSSPVQTVAAGTTWSDASCGLSHMMGLKTDGTLWGWGRNEVGQLGNNSITHRSSPVQTVASGTNWKQISCGQIHTMGIKYDGTLWGWGNNANGELGDNTGVRKSSPVQTVAGGTNWKQVSCGHAHTAAIKTDGTLWCWGDGTLGEIGDNNLSKRSSPVQTVANGTNWRSISCGYRNNSAIKTDGTLWVWGYNLIGALGTNDLVHRSSPVQTAAYGNTWKTLGRSVVTRSNFIIKDFEF
jgi:alpha-tubulin suppressor-like RCC1 family protein